LRGKSLKVKGRVFTEKDACKSVRVDVAMKHDDLPAPRVIGSLSTDDEGRFEGSIIVPRDVNAGGLRRVRHDPWRQALRRRQV
jgi:hypothetical protein